MNKIPLQEELHSQQSSFGKYWKKAAGDISLPGLFLYECFALLAANLGGGLGYWLRKKLSRYLFRSTGKGLILGRGLTVRHPEQIEFGDNVAVDDYVFIDASGSGDIGIQLRDGVVLSRNCSILGKNGHVVFEEGANVGCNCVFASVAGITVGASSLIAGNCYVGGGRYYDDNLHAAIMDQGVYSRGEIVIGENSWIGAGVVILDGVRVGRGAIVGAGSVVTREVPDFAVVTGVPAKVVRFREQRTEQDKKSQDMKKGWKSIARVAVMVAAVFLGDLAIAEAADDRVAQWTGGHTRLVWLQDQGNGTDARAEGKNLMLYGYDSADGKGERPLLAAPDSWYKPLISPNGRQVVVSNRAKRQMYLVEWDSGKIRELGDGVAVAIWQDPKPSLLLRRTTTWVYCLSGPQPENPYGSAQPLYRFPLDNPKKKELVWNKTHLQWSNIQLSRDGELMGGLFPWPDGGVLWLKDKRLQRLGKGCWTSLSPDNSKLLWIFDGLHRNLQIHDVPGGKSWSVNINGAPGIGGYEVYHPRWSNHPRYFVVTGPYMKGEGGNKILGGGEKVEIYIGRFDERVHKVEAWLKVTDNGRADFFPDLWIDGGSEATLAGSAGEANDTTVAAWPASRDHLVFIWENMKAANQVDEQSPIGFFQSNIDLRGTALFTRDFRLATGGGWADTGEAGGKIGEALARTGEAGVEFTLTPREDQRGRIVSLTAGGKPGLVVSQQGNDLLVQTGGGEAAVWPGLLAARQPLHLVLNVRGDGLELFAGGRSLGKKPGTFKPAEAPVDSLQFGDPAAGWHGILDGLAIYDRPLENGHIAANNRSADNRNTTRPAGVDRLVIEGKLDQTTEIPAADTLGAYRRALVVNTYSVDRVEGGAYGQDRILVAEWAILDRAPIKTYDPARPPERLILEKFSDHPELAGERQLMDVFEPDLEMYYRLPQSLN